MSTLKRSRVEPNSCSAPQLLQRTSVWKYWGWMVAFMQSLSGRGGTTPPLARENESGPFGLPWEARHDQRRSPEHSQPQERTMHIAILGSGRIGATLARRLTEAGHEVRSPTREERRRSG